MKMPSTISKRPGGNGTPATSPSPNGAEVPPPTFAVNSPIRQRQPRWVLLLGVALVIVAVLAVVYVVNNMRETSQVLVMAKPVQQGQTISAGDLKTAEINSDSGLAAVPQGQQSQVVGRVAAVPLSAGTVLNPSDVTVGLIPGPEQSLVGITVSQDKMPAAELVAGDIIRLVDTPRDQDDSPAQGPITTEAQVVSTRLIPEQRMTTIDVLVPQGEASWVSARAATHRVGVVLDSRKR